MKNIMFTRIPETEVTITYDGKSVTFPPFANNTNLSALREAGKVVFRKMSIGDDSDKTYDTWVAIRKEDESKFDNTTLDELIPCMTVDGVTAIGLAQYVYIAAGLRNGTREFLLEKLDYQNSTYVQHREVWGTRKKSRNSFKW